MRNIYIILSQSGTNISKALKFFTKEPYNHSSIALSEDLNKFYSFGRLAVNNPLNGGFVIESTDSGVFKKYPSSKCVILKVEVTDTQYEVLENTIHDFIKKKDLYKYDFINVALANTKFHIKTRNKFFCSEFVAYVLEKASIPLPVPREHIHPFDFLKLDNHEIIYEGILQNYHEYRKKTVMA